MNILAIMLETDVKITNVHKEILVFSRRAYLEAPVFLILKQNMKQVINIK